MSYTVGERAEPTRLRIFAVLGDALTFGLRHVVALSVLGLLMALPQYLHSFLPREVLRLEKGVNSPAGQEIPEALARGMPLPRPAWETEFALPMAEALLAAVAVAVVLQVLVEERRGRRWPVFPGLLAAVPRLPAALAAAAVLVGSMMLLGLLLDVVAQQGRFVALFVGIPLLAVSVCLAVAFCLAVPCAVTGRFWLIEAFNESATLTAGQRWRIVGAYLVGSLPVAALAGGLLVGLSIPVTDIPPLWFFLLKALAGITVVVVTVMLYDALLALKEGRRLGSEFP